MIKQQKILQTPLIHIPREQGYGNLFYGFQNPKRIRITNVLIVSSLYDLYLFEEDGRLYDLTRTEYEGVTVTQTPELICVSSGKEALYIAQHERRFDLIVTTLHIDDMDADEFARMVQQSGLNIPVVLLMHDNRELQHFLRTHDTSVFENVFIWQGDFRLILAIIKTIEDKLNVEHDTKAVGVQSLLVVEDNIKYYSYLLPILYNEFINQSQRLAAEGIDLGHKFLQMRASPKILLCTTYEEAWAYYQRYKHYLLGIISDIDFPKDGTPDPKAGIQLTREVRKERFDLPILLLSNAIENKRFIEKLNVSFIAKTSPKFLSDLRKFLENQFRFGDFVFQLPDGTEIARARDMKSLEELLKVVPEESIRYHADRNHFSAWLKARTEFWLADQIRPRKVSDFPTVEDLRRDLINTLHHYQQLCQRGVVATFSKELFGTVTNFARIGLGSLGGKARGLGFVNMLITDYSVHSRYENVKIFVPPAVVLGTNVFDEFLIRNVLYDFALDCSDDAEITRQFTQASYFPPEVIDDLRTFLEIVKTPLAVRSSSMLEDSQYYPFAGVYETYMLSNNHPDVNVRLKQLLNAIKHVYASTFFQRAKNYVRAASYKPSDEKMGVIIQCLVGRWHGNRYYPDISGVAKSYNFYPAPGKKAEDGIMSLALGLGKWVVEGGNTVRLCPKYPNDSLQFISANETMETSQREFFALIDDPANDASDLKHRPLVKKFSLSDAEADGVLSFLASTYVPENDAIYSGTSRTGTRVITFAPLLQQSNVPLAEVVELLLEMGEWGIGAPVEIEFAVNVLMGTLPTLEFALLQVRPLVIRRELEELNIAIQSKESILCETTEVLGHGKIQSIYDIIAVDYEHFERSKTQVIAKEISRFNAMLLDENRPYLLIAVGRLGSLDPWLGIPVRWEDICGARAIVETNFRDMNVEPSQATHFFHNVTSFQVCYLTVNDFKKLGFFDWSWLLSQEPYQNSGFVKWYRFNNPLTIVVNGQTKKGIIQKPH
ncbi:MAG: histidine kinase [Bacteroidetes bacterium]|nr:histidine kinase [Bacteroidota bacterium]